MPQSGTASPTSCPFWSARRAPGQGGAKANAHHEPAARAGVTAKRKTARAPLPQHARWQPSCAARHHAALLFARISRAADAAFRAGGQPVPS